MGCEEVRILLDQLMDGELTDEQRLALEAHRRECPRCDRDVRAAIQLKALFSQMEPEVDVPLPAQAKWRAAVREAAREKRKKRAIRWIGSAAAAVVLVAGLGLALRQRAPEPSAAIPLRAANVTAVEKEAASEPRDKAFAAAYEAAVIETDGAAEAAGEEVEEFAAENETQTLRAPACEVTLRVEDVDAACAHIADLAEEYEGSADVQPLDGTGANLFVELSAADAGDFLKAVLPLDVADPDRALPELPGEGSTLILLVLAPAEK